MASISPLSTNTYGYPTIPHEVCAFFGNVEGDYVSSQELFQAKLDVKMTKHNHAHNHQIYQIGLPPSAIKTNHDPSS